MDMNDYPYLQSCVGLFLHCSALCDRLGKAQSVPDDSGNPNSVACDRLADWRPWGLYVGFLWDFRVWSVAVWKSRAQPQLLRVMLRSAVVCWLHYE